MVEAMLKRWMLRDPGRLPRHLLGQRIVVREIGKAAEPLVALIRRRRVAVGPGGDVARRSAPSSGRGERSMSMPVAADHEIRDDRAPARCSSRCARPSIARALENRRRRDAARNSRAGAAVIGRLREALAQRQDRAHEAPAPGIVEIAEMAQEAAEGQPAIGLDDLRLARGGRADAPRRAGLQRGRRIVEGRGAGADHGDALARERGEIDRLARYGRAACGGSAASGAGSVQSPRPSCPVASTTLRAYRVSWRACRCRTVSASRSRRRARCRPPPPRCARGCRSDMAEPVEIVGPKLLRDQARALPALLPNLASCQDW